MFLNGDKIEYMYGQALGIEKLLKHTTNKQYWVQEDPKTGVKGDFFSLRVFW